MKDGVVKFFPLLLKKGTWVPLVSEASAFHLCVELMSLAHICGGNLVSGFGRHFLKAHMQGLACGGEQHVLLES